MSDLSHQTNSETRGTAPFQLFEADSSVPPPGTKATPRPPDRPRVSVPIDSSGPAFHVLESEGFTTPKA